MEDSVPMEYDMALAVRRGDRELQARLERALHEQSDAIRSILTEFGVPLVRCDSCIISGDLPSHGPYAPAAPAVATPKSGAASNVTIAMLNDWLRHGADVNVELSNAVLADDSVRVSYLLEKKHANVDAVDLQGETPLHHALTRHSLAMVKLLIGHGASANQRDRDGWTPLMTAAWVDDAEAIKLLVANHADTNAASAQNLTPLAIALQYGKKTAALALLDSGTDANRVIGDAGYTPLMLAIASHTEATVRALIQKGADVNARNDGGVTALMVAAADDQAELAALLVRSGANVAAQNDRGDTALSIARAKGSQAVIELLDEQHSPAANPVHPGA
jgi:ankyrin repeat protein